jgi:RNA-directed DNA polymerase
LLILDFANFFESIHLADVFSLLRRNAGRFVPELTEEDAVVISRVATRFGRLTIGAPSSPVLSNAIMYEFDSVVSSICKSRGVLYSRYADDMHFSSINPGVLSDIAARVRGEVERIETPNLILMRRRLCSHQEGTRGWLWG